ncbi:hypothetical protein [Pontibacter pamirensis]|uniref:hypothetical protein n=1 Tax=Pontibacter pamirensis TaxID=2562824 RepID=UPI001389A98E|nr:hypothetical protein [Pontibacter pamirensis]
MEKLPRGLSHIPTPLVVVIVFMFFFECYPLICPFSFIKSPNLPRPLQKEEVDTLTFSVSFKKLFPTTVLLVKTGLMSFSSLPSSYPPHGAAGLKHEGHAFLLYLATVPIGSRSSLRVVLPHSFAPLLQKGLHPFAKK